MLSTTSTSPVTKSVTVGQIISSQ